MDKWTAYKVRKACEELECIMKISEELANRV